MPDTSFVHGLCIGRIEEDQILPFPGLDESEAEMLEAVIESIDDALGSRHEEFRAWDVEGEMPAEFIEELKMFGLFGLVIPEEHGGLEFGTTAYSRTLQQVARHDASVAVTVGAHSSIGMRGLLLYGTEEQKARWLPDLATGDMLAAFCLTEPGAGSDAASVRTTARREGDEWVIDGEKLWVTNGGIADFFTVFAKTGEPEERGNMSAFVVTRDMEGVSTGGHEDKMGIRASSTCSLFLDGVRVPDAHRLGPEGDGFKVAMRILNSGRTGLGGGCVGGMKRLIELATAHASQREQFERPIAEFGMIKQKLGQMVIDCYATESVVGVVNGLIDRGHTEYAVEAAISKVFGTEALWRTADEALQVAGGTGYMREYPYERVMRDSRINRIFEGTNEVLRLFVALTSMNEVGKTLSELSSSLRGIFDDPIKGFGLMADYARQRAALAGVGRGAPSFEGLVPELADEAEAFVASSRQLGGAVDRVLRKHGKKIIGKQFASRRLADIMIDLFVLASVLGRVSTSVERQGADAAARELDIARAFSSQALQRVQVNLERIDDNDDELIKALADDAVERQGFGWDIF